MPSTARLHHSNPSLITSAEFSCHDFHSEGEEMPAVFPHQRQYPLLTVPYENTVQSTAMATEFHHNTATSQLKGLVSASKIVLESHSPFASGIKKLKQASGRSRALIKPMSSPLALGEPAPWTNSRRRNAAKETKRLPFSPPFPKTTHQSRSKKLLKRASFSPNSFNHQESFFDSDAESSFKNARHKRGSSLESLDPTTLRRHRVRPRIKGLSNQEVLYQEYDDLFEDEPWEEGDGDKNDEGAQYLACINHPTSLVAQDMAVQDMHQTLSVGPLTPPDLSDAASSAEDSSNGSEQDIEPPLPPSPLPPVTPLKVRKKTVGNEVNRKSYTSSTYSSVSPASSRPLSTCGHQRGSWSISSLDSDTLISEVAEMTSRIERGMDGALPLLCLEDEDDADSGDGGDDAEEVEESERSKAWSGMPRKALPPPCPHPKIASDDLRLPAPIGQRGSTKRKEEQRASPPCRDVHAQKSADAHHQHRLIICTQIPPNARTGTCDTPPPPSPAPLDSPLTYTLAPFASSGFVSSFANSPPTPPTSSAGGQAREAPSQPAPASCCSPAPSSVYSVSCDDLLSAPLEREHAGAFQHQHQEQRDSVRGLNISNLYSPTNICSTSDEYISILPARPDSSLLDEPQQNYYTLALSQISRERTDDSLQDHHHHHHCGLESQLTEEDGSKSARLDVDDPSRLDAPKVVVGSETFSSSASASTRNMRTQPTPKACLFAEVEGLGVAPLFYKKKAIPSPLNMDSISSSSSSASIPTPMRSSIHLGPPPTARIPRKPVRSSIILDTSLLSPRNVANSETNFRSPPSTGGTVVASTPLDNVRDSMITSVQNVADSDLKFLENCEPWTPDEPKKTEKEQLFGSIDGVAEKMDDERSVSDASEVIGDNLDGDSMKEVVEEQQQQPPTMVFNPSAWQYYDMNSMMPPKEEDVRDSRPPEVVVPKNPEEDTAYLKEFKHIIKNSGPNDAFLAQLPRLEAMQSDRITRHLKDAPKNGYGKQPRLTKAMRAREVKFEIMPNLWSLMAQRWLCFGKVVASPAHDVLLAASAKKLSRQIIKRQDKRASEMLEHGVNLGLDDGEKRRVLDLGGDAIAGWGWHCALDYPKAKVYTITQAPIEQHETDDEQQSPSNPTAGEDEVLPRKPKNHRHIKVECLWNLPFPDNHFDLISARTLFAIASTVNRTSTYSGKLLDEMDLILEECNRILKPTGYLEFLLFDAEVINAGPAGQKFNFMFSSHLREHHHDPQPTSRFIRRLGRMGFKDIKRAWIFNPIAPTELGPKAPPKDLPLPPAPGSPGKLGPQPPTRPSRTNLPVDPELTPAKSTGSAQNVAGVTGLLAGWMLEKWGLAVDIRTGGVAEMLAEVMREEVEGKQMGGFRTLVGWARKTVKGGVRTTM